MKRNKFILFVVAAMLMLLAILLVINNSKSTIEKEIINFAVDDTANITMIFLSDKNNQSVTLKRTDQGQWLVNEKYRAHKENIDLLLKTLINLAIMEPVSDVAHNTVIKIMAASAVKVEIYQLVYRINLFNKIRLFRHEKLTRTYYVGHVTQSNIGTYMLMEGSTRPFIVYMPGFRGFVASRYRTLEEGWRDHTVFNTKLKNIASVTVEFPARPDLSYKVVNKNDRDLTLTSNTNNSEIADYDTLALFQFITSFENIRFEAFKNDMPPEIIDSITSSQPMHIITLVEKSGKEHVVKNYYKPGFYGEVDYKGDHLLHDRDRFYSVLNDGRDFTMNQYFVFDKITRPLSHFLKNEKQN